MVSHGRSKEITAEHLALKRSKAAWADSRLNRRSAGDAIRNKALIRNIVRHKRNSVWTEHCCPLESGWLSDLCFHPQGVSYFFFPTEILMAPLKSLNWMFLYQVTNHL